ncbi:MAG: sigma-54-dependent Fis family transcriptional regulator [Roseicyclus sp.]|nr:sigma-54-dependent Fis family transcriptional regulator [Roseicyclus sp.]
MDSTQTVLVKSKDPQVVEALSNALSEVEGYRVIYCENDKTAVRRLNEIEVNLIICDLDEPLDEHSSALIQARLSHSGCCRIVISDSKNMAEGIALCERTASFLYIAKPFDHKQIKIAAKRALEHTELSRRHRILSRELKLSLDDDMFARADNKSVQGGISQFERLVYASPKMAQVVEEAKIAAKTNMPVLIQGDTGTGKELLARAIHFNSDRINSPMLNQNCGGVTADALYSELFGHVRGGFPGAISDRLGLFRAADGGTVFLDEISEISSHFQIALLRFLQEGEVKPLGSDITLHSTVRIIAASNKSIETMVEKGTFRRDLYYRLRGFLLEVPPLNQRKEDIPALTDFFVEKYAGVVGRRVLGVTSDALKRLENYSFPGNVRELENEVQRMVAVAENGGYIALRHLSEKIATAPIETPENGAYFPAGATLKEKVENLEQAVLIKSLAVNHWNQSKVALELGLSRVGLANKIKRYELRKEAGRV